MKTILILSICALVFLSGTLLLSQKVYSDEFDDLTHKIQELERSLTMSKDATTPLEARVKDLKHQLSGIEERVAFIESSLTQKRIHIESGYRNLSAQRHLFEEVVRNQYIKSQVNSALLIFISSKDAQNVTRILAYQKREADQNKAIITNIALTLISLEEQKKQLETEEQKLVKLKLLLASEKQELEKVVKGAKEYQDTLLRQIAELTARQQAILTARSGTFTTSVGDVPLTDDPNARPDFDPGFRPAFSAFSFGAYTHRKGMSQYGAKGRAESGQNYKEILRSYYGREPVQKDTGGTISVGGFGNLEFEGYYLLGIAEMPSNWTKEALKAQAVAARSYAYRYKQEGRTICTTEACQVFRKGKADNSPGEWRAAVEETRGEVIEDVITYYSSTTGGFITTIGWDTTDGQGGPGFATRAWESKAKSPWFYKGWYTENYYNDSAKCERSHPWLTQEEFADILNAWVVRQRGSGDEVKRILPVTIKSCPVGGGSDGTEPFSMEEMRSKANTLEGAYTSISGVTVEYSNEGNTARVKIQTNRGELNLSGTEFKSIFNLRAPGYISIRNALFNIEKK